jgi:iron-sulfur cluster assembly protein
MITLTDAAANKMLQSIQLRESGIGIRLGVKTTGCSGLMYILEYVDNPEDDDLVYCINNVQIFVKKKDYVYLDNLTVDYVKQGLNYGFEFVNPLEVDRCGCGLSFRV